MTVPVARAAAMTGSKFPVHAGDTFRAAMTASSIGCGP
jgi:hypothetical protein